jgi:predicted nucleic-acid-binding Zn-ribbon protein
MFTRLPRKSRFGLQSSATSIAGQMYESALKHTHEHPGRWPEYRPSAFPICGILVFQRLLEGSSTGQFTAESNGAGSLFCNMGTAAHQALQFHMGFSRRLFGDWQCLHPFCEEHKLALTGNLTRRNSTNNYCPKCMNPMHYVEKEIRLNGLRGHIDGLIRLADGTFWVLDFKTTTRNILENSKLPKKAHLLQLVSYCYVLAEKYKLKIAGFSVLYLTRDNPFNYKECSYDWSSKWYAFGKTTVETERQKYLDGLQGFVHLDTTEIIANKQCVSRAFYDKEIAYYNECPLVGVCFNRNTLSNKLSEIIALHPTNKHSRIRLAKQIYAKTFN